MIVECIQRSGRNIATGETQKFNSYWVVLDGERVGCIGWKPDDKFLPYRELGPIEMKAIREKLDDAFDRRVLSKNPPKDIPEEVLNDDNEGKQFEDDFADP